MITGETLRVLSKEQKIGFVLLLCFGVIVVVLGVIQLRNTIYSPFVIEAPDETDNLAALFANNETKLQQIDTDRDGLNDYEELNFYETSPYLPDTDSDGVGDKDELTVGTDPNCPSGKECESAQNIPRNENTAEIPLFDFNSSTQALLTGSSSTSTSPTSTPGMTQAELAVIAKNPVLLRQLLLQTGQIKKEQLDAISDEVLLQQAEQFLKSGSNGTTN